VGSLDADAAPFQYPFAISGFTRDSSGAVLPFCTVTVFRTADGSVAAVGQSDANGYYLLYASSALAHYVVAYKAGAPDVAGTTVNTLVGA
jgi:hypothetical protein